MTRKTEKKSNLKLNVLYPIIACILFAGCTTYDGEKNVVVVPGKNKIVVKDVKDGRERLFFTNKNDNRFQYLHAGDTGYVWRKKGGNYYRDKIFNDDGKDAQIDIQFLRAANQRHQFDSIKNAMLMDGVAQNKR